MKIRTFIYLSLALLLAFSCAPGKGGAKQAETLATRKFPATSLPAMVQDQQEALQFMSQHFWDMFLKPTPGYRCDSLYIAGVEKGELEQNFANFTYILDHMNMNEARKSLASLAAKAEAYEQADSASNVFEGLSEIVERYLFDPNSPLRNEDYFQAYADRLSRSAFLAPATRDKYAYISRMCALNAVGTKAADFVFADKTGRQRNLHSIKADYTLLFFSNPGCESCMEIIKALKANQKVNQMLAAGQLAVVNVYIDEDIQAWRDYMPVYPEAWYNGFDPNLIIRNENTYNVRAIPSLYMLDSQKTVLLKDAVPERLFELIEGI